MTDRQAIGHSPLLRDHWWWRPGWRQGRRAYAFHVTFNHGVAADGGDSLRRLVREYQRAVVGLGGLDPIPAEWLHLTVQGIGFVDDVSEDDVRAIVAAASRRCGSLAPFELTFGPAVVADEGIILPGTPEGPAQTLRRTLRVAIADVWHPGRVPEDDAFISHVTVAYSNADGSTERHVRAVDSAAPEPATVTVRVASLIVLDRDARMYRWAPYASVALGPT
jgi:2'-5' RNA ligase